MFKIYVAILLTSLAASEFTMHYGKEYKLMQQLMKDGHRVYIDGQEINSDHDKVQRLFTTISTILGNFEFSKLFQYAFYLMGNVGELYFHETDLTKDHRFVGRFNCLKDGLSYIAILGLQIFG